ncbi:MAG: HAD family hydrolase [Pseudomonadota bacterium]
MSVNTNGPDTTIRRIAMWSGPRNLSTAMMRAFSSRSDTAVIDEPFYAAYLAVTGLDHPMRDAILASQPTDPRAAAADLAGRVAAQKIAATVQYEKHMTHHMVEVMPRDWFNDATHVFLIRRPERVIASYAAKRETVTLDDLGFERQTELFDLIAATARSAPAVVDCDAILADPETQLAALCADIDLPFEEAMLSWPTGQHPADGIWGAHWYGAVERSTGFAPARALPKPSNAHQRALTEAAMPHYDHLAAYLRS